MFKKRLITAITAVVAGAFAVAGASAVVHQESPAAQVSICYYGTGTC